jgi:GrpB-like predicted nucleotidyltransferase (UPF0157 family)
VSEYNNSEIIEIVEYTPKWATTYQQEKELINAVLNQELLDIQHIGSTSVPGLGAKPILDILIAVQGLGTAEKYCTQLQSLGYEHVSHAEDAERLFFRKGTPRTHHLHIVEHGSWTYWRHILFRDYLLAHPEIAQQYEQLKREMALKFKADRVAYTQSKAKLVQLIVAQALAEADRLPIKNCGTLIGSG